MSHRVKERMDCGTDCYSLKMWLWSRLYKVRSLGRCTTKDFFWGVVIELGWLSIFLADSVFLIKPQHIKVRVFLACRHHNHSNMA